MKGPQMNTFLPKMVLSFSLLVPSLLSCVDNQPIDINKELNKYKKELEKIRKHIGYEDRYRKKIEEKKLTCDELYKKVIDEMHNEESLSSKEKIKEKIKVLLTQGSECLVERPNSIFQYRNAPHFPEFLESLADVVKKQSYGGLARKICNETVIDHKFYFLGLEQGKEHELDSKYYFILSCLPCLERRFIDAVCEKERNELHYWDYQRILVFSRLEIDALPCDENTWERRRQFVTFLEKEKHELSYFPSLKYFFLEKLYSPSKIKYSRRTGSLIN